MRITLFYSKTKEVILACTHTWVTLIVDCGPVDHVVFLHGNQPTLLTG